MRLRLALALLAVVAIGVGCGSNDESSDERGEAGQQAHERAQAEEVRAEEAESECDPNYSGACLDPYASDYDCKGGSGNGPLYTGPVVVVGEDHYGLDADSDSSACESY